MLSAVPLFAVGGFTVTLAEVLLLGATAYYLTLDPRARRADVRDLGALHRRGPAAPGASSALALFVVGWIFQFVGHYVYEKRSPAFFRNLAHLLVGPLWILAKATGRS